MFPNNSDEGEDLINKKLQRASWICLVWSSGAADTWLFQPHTTGPCHLEVRVRGAQSSGMGAVLSSSSHSHHQSILIEKAHMAMLPS